MVCGMESKNASAVKNWLRQQLYKLSQPPQGSTALKNQRAALTCTKNINDCPEAA
jgi:hypothetical protein